MLNSRHLGQRLDPVTAPIGMSGFGIFPTCHNVQLESVTRFKADVCQGLSFYGFTPLAWLSPLFIH